MRTSLTSWQLSYSTAINFVRYYALSKQKSQKISIYANIIPEILGNYIQLTPTQLIRRMGAGLVIAYGLGLIHPLPRRSVIYIRWSRRCLPTRRNALSGLHRRHLRP